MTDIQQIWRKIMPDRFRAAVRRIRLYPLLMARYNHGENKQKHFKELAYIRKNHSAADSVIFGGFMDRAVQKETEVFFDGNKQLHYVLDDGKRLYWGGGHKAEDIARAYNWLAGEQDLRSPHRYVEGEFDIVQDAVLFDVGSAEGMLTLRNIDRCKSATLFECDEGWIKALEATFEPYKDKVEVVRKYVSDTNDKDNITIDQYIKDSGKIPSFIKIDIEGFETKALKGMADTLKSTQDLRLAVCAYHALEAEEEIREHFKNYSCDINKSDGWMLYTMCAKPTFVTGVLRVTVNGHKR